MIKSLYFGNHAFADKSELIKAIKENEKEIIALKKSMVHKSLDKQGQSLPFIDLQTKNEASKGLEIIAKENFIYPVINSTGYFDSHEDVHLKGCFNKSIQEQQGNIFLVDSHSNKIADIISMPEDIKMLITEVDWQTLGKNYSGSTESLVFEIAADKFRADALKVIKSVKNVECSLRMQYKDIFFAVNSTDKYYAKNKEMYDQYIGEIVNKDEVAENGYFFGVSQLAIIKEGSICPIIGGSNSATTVYEPLKAAAKSNTSDTEDEPLQDTQTKRSNLFIKI